jgi:hypothetical protein
MCLPLRGSLFQVVPGEWAGSLLDLIAGHQAHTVERAHLWREVQSDTPRGLKPMGSQANRLTG